MTIAIRAAALGAALAIAAPLAAQAATVSYTDPVLADLGYSESATKASGGSATTTFAEFGFTVRETLTIDSFSLSASGTNAGADVTAITFEYLLNGTVIQSGALQLAPLFPGQPPTTKSRSAYYYFVSPVPAYADGDVLTFLFKGKTTNPASVTVSFATESIEIPPVPLPAAGGLLLLALGAGVAAGRRKG